MNMQWKYNNIMTILWRIIIDKPPLDIYLDMIKQMI